MTALPHKTFYPCGCAGEAVRTGRDRLVNEALLRVRRLLRSELQAVVSVCETLEGADGCLSTLQVVQLLQHEQLLPGERPDSPSPPCAHNT